MTACFTEEAEENFVPDSARTLKSDVANYFADSKEEFCNEQPPEGLCSFNEGKNISDKPTIFVQFGDLLLKWPKKGRKTRNRKMTREK